MAHTGGTMFDRKIHSSHNVKHMLWHTGDTMFDRKIHSSHHTKHMLWHTGGTMFDRRDSNTFERAISKSPSSQGQSLSRCHRKNTLLWVCIVHTASSQQ